MPLTLIAAVAENGCIGKANTLPWYLPEDLKRFKALTSGNTVLMGRKTWESLPEQFRPLPNRTNIVLTRQEAYPLPAGVERAGDIADVLDAHPYDNLFVIGGAEVYAQALPLADALEITRVHQTVEGDAFFPAIDLAEWDEVAREDHDGFSFLTYHRKAS